MNADSAQTSIKKIHTEVVKLNPSAIVVLFEIDLTDIAIVEELFYNLSFSEGASGSTSKVFRFHNNLKLINSSIFFGGNEYTALPIQADGFETSSKGTAPTPKLSITASEEGLKTGSFTSFKKFMKDLDDLVGAKVTRTKTFAKHLDRINFYRSNEVNSSNYNLLISSFLPAPDDFDPDPNAFFPPDIYYIDRKAVETNSLLEFELSSAFDLQEVKLPGRMLLQTSCVWRYRGEGCCYENNRINSTHGDATLLASAPPIANEKDEIIKDVVGALSSGGVALIDSGLWSINKAYVIGNFVFITAGGINYYFVCKKDHQGSSPPNQIYWLQDQCSKTLAGCKLRWGAGSPARNVSINSSNPQKEKLPFGGFPGISKR